MPDYVVTGPDGRQLRFTGPEAPSQAMIDQGFQKLPDPQRAWQKAQGIGPARVGERYLPTGGPMGILDVIRTALGGAQRPASVAAQDPYGIQAWEKGAGPMPTPIAAETQAVGPGITAYHGSPYDFEKFDLGKIGTGEGAQAYGHGLYFAEDPSVAEYYKESLTQSKRTLQPITYAGTTFPPGTGTHRVLDEMLEKGKAQTVSDMERHVKFLEGYAPDQARLQQHYLDFARNVDLDKIAGQPVGKTYQVSIAAHPDQFLDWDKPLSQQPEIAQRLKAAPEFVTRLDPNDEVITGQHILANYPTQAAAAQRLRELGISGIKYLDQGSRAAGEGSRNFVVFDDSLISIMKKYGIALPFFAGMSRLAQRQPQGQP